MKRTLGLIFLASVVGLFSCEKTDRPDETANWWVRADYKGIKSEEIGFIYHSMDGSTNKRAMSQVSYNRNGTRASCKSEDQEIYYYYNPDGTYDKTECIYYVYDNSSESFKKSWSCTRKYEYDNSGKFVLLMGYLSNPLSIGDGPLIPNLSRVTDTNIFTDRTTVDVWDYSFDGDKLTVTFSRDNNETDDPIVIEYRGAYPYQGQDAYAFFGPVTYQDNGMFDTIHDGRIIQGEKSGERTVYYQKGRTDKMLIDKIVDTDEGVRSFFYNEQGDCIKTMLNSDVIMTAEYEYDSRGEWINKIEKEKYYENGHPHDRTTYQYRIVEYY